VALKVTQEKMDAILDSLAELIIESGGLSSLPSLPCLSHFLSKFQGIVNQEHQMTLISHIFINNVNNK
jgi:hypothetical protein